MRKEHTTIRELRYTLEARYARGAALAIRLRTFITITALCVATLLWAGASADAQSISYTNSGAGGRSASASFAIVSGNLQVTLTSLGAEPVGNWDGTYALSALFFNTTLSLKTDPSAPIAGDSAAVGSGGGVVGTIPAGNTIGSFWAYGTGLSGPGGATAGLLSTGFSVGGPSAGNLGPPPSEQVDGLDGAILGWNNTTGANSSVTGHEPLAYDSIVFTLVGTGLPGSLSPSDFSDVTFQFGTDTSSPNFSGIVVPAPEPTILTGGVLLLPLLGARRLRKSRSV
jgi:hypothetical protein